MNTQDQKLMNARIQAAKKLQHLCWDAAHQEPKSFLNRDRAQEVVDAIVVCVLETMNTYLEENKDAAANAK
jgi:hypothetical protein